MHAREFETETIGKERLGEALIMRKFLFTIALSTMAGFGVHVVTVSAQSTIVADGSALSLRLANDRATKGTRIVTLGAAGRSALKTNLAVEKKGSPIQAPGAASIKSFLNA